MIEDKVIVPVLANTIYKERDFQMWLEKETKISEIRTLLEEGYEVEVTSPDGYVPVSAFVDKGMWKEYVLNTDLGDEVWCNENHLFETDRGWILTKDLVDTSFKVLTKDGFIRATVIQTGHDIPIVDIQVDHENHRYYTNGISSHNTGVGKSLFLCHHAANCLKQNQNVLYITCEMAEERIAERIDANLLDITMDDLKQLPKSMYDNRINKVSAGIKGKLIIKEYPTATANVNNFRFLLDELWLKKRFKPSIIFIDYLNICASARLKNGNNINSYTYVKSIAEELRGLAVEYNVPLFSATQTNRTGFQSNDVGLEDTSESFGLPATADFMFAMISTDELDEMNQILIKQLKNRYNDTVLNRKFILGINRAKMKLTDAKKEDQTNIPTSAKKDFFGMKESPSTPNVSWKF